MPREMDKRDYGFRVSVPAQGLTREFEAAFKSAPASSSTMGNIDPFTGSITRVDLSDIDWRTAPRRRLAIELARHASEAVAGFTGGETPDFGLAAEVQRTASETEVLHLQQYYHGIPVFQASRTIQFRPGDKASLTGSVIENLAEVETEPRLSVDEAVQIAARHVATPGEEEEVEPSGFGDQIPAPSIEIGGFEARILASFDLAMRPTVLTGAPFEGPISAHLVYFYQGPKLRLAWHVVLVFPGATADYAVLVAAAEEEPGEVLYARNRVCNLLGQCEVHAHNPQETPKALVSFPAPADAYPTTVHAFPAGGAWLHSAETSGNNVTATDQSGVPFAGDQQSDTVDFTPGTAGEDAVAHTFYFCNVMHDFFLALGFDAVAGNFQAANEGGEPGAGDAVRAVVFPDPVAGVATMQTPPDGQAPLMRMGLFGQTNRHTGLDSDVVFHEFVHGVTNRLVGGRLNSGALQEPQSGGMGEGWSDYFALTFHNARRGTDKSVTGDWVTGRPQGIRGFPYDDDFPHGFGNLSGGRYSGSVHARGEIWCAALMRATRSLSEALGDKARGYAIAWQAVVDGLKLAPANPSFLDARDAILTAIDDLGKTGTIKEAEQAEALRAFWLSFAHFGMGLHASSIGPTLLGIVADGTLPPDL
ncbi:MAG: M36 family metallopeptidase [Allosphingosinicella sp.]|uniref:M36 family metallopeptidase n=1 Tax=Allosphingosinicella sp. TaxID=2823234 RepID=UPI0039253922